MEKYFLQFGKTFLFTKTRYKLKGIYNLFYQIPKRDIVSLCVSHPGLKNLKN